MSGYVLFLIACVVLTVGYIRIAAGRRCRKEIPQYTMGRVEDARKNRL